MATRILATLADTAAFAKEVALSCKGGEVLGLIGDLGAGKTAFTQLLAQSLGVVREVKSPTFTLMQCYPTGEAAQAQGIARLCHVDAYRIADEKELRGIGIEEYAGDPQTVTVVEWADLAPFLKRYPGYRELRFSLEGQGRKIEWNA